MEKSDSFEWPADAKRYEFLGVIGKGAFAKVYKARCLDNNAIVSIKILKLEDPSINLEDTRKEVLTMKLCDHENVLTCYCCFNVGCSLWIVTPLMIKGSFLRILQYLSSQKRIQDGQGFEECIVAYIIRETAKALKYLHDSNLLHRDVKAGNILVDADANIRLADLGVARVLEGTVKKQEARTFVGTPCWMAPEVMNRERYNSRADIWSLGITALELFKGYPPLAKFEPMEILIRTVQGESPSFASYNDSCPIKPSSAFVGFISSVLKKDPAQRYSADKVLSHRWLAIADQGREALKKLLETIPDLEGLPDVPVELPGLEVHYVKNTTWDFSGVQGLKDSKNDKWLGEFTKASVKETEAP